MRKHYILFVFALFLLQGFSQVEKKVIAEHFTNTRCSICASKNPAFFSLLDNNPDVLHIAYHPSSPYPTCIFSQHNVTGNDGRANFYGVYGGTPRVVLNGEVLAPSTPLLSQQQLDPFLDQLSDYSISIRHQKETGNLVAVEITVRKESGSGGANLTLTAQLAESTIAYAAPNGEAEHHNVYRTTLLETAVSISNAGDSVVVAENYTPHPEWQEGEMVVVVLLQDSQDKAIVQAGRSGFASPVSRVEESTVPAGSFYPNPVTDVLSFNQALLGEYTKAELYAVYGRKVLESDLRSGLDVRLLPPGAYFLVFHHKTGEVRTAKLLKSSR